MPAVSPIDIGDAPMPLGSNMALARQSGGTGFGDPIANTAVPLATSPAPEVATWAMMVSGAGLVGGAMRWRRGDLAA